MKIIAALVSCALFASALGLTACQVKDYLPTSVPMGEEVAQAAYAGGTPWVASEIDGNVTADTPTDVKSDFALYANKDDLLSLELTDEKPSAGTAPDLAYQMIEDTKRMFNEGKPKSHDAQLAHDLYWLIQDWDGRNALGVKPLEEQIDAIKKIRSIEELNVYFIGTAPEKRQGTPWDFAVVTDPTDSTRKIISFGNIGLTLGDSAEYEKETDRGTTLKEAHGTLAKKVLGKCGYSEQEAAKMFDNSLAFEKMLAQAICTNDEKRSPDYLERSDKHYTRAEVEKMQKDLPILAELEQAEGYPACDEYLMPEPNYFAKLSEVYTEKNLNLMKDYLIVRAATTMSDSLDRECHEWFSQATNTFDGMTEMIDDETYAANIVNRVSNAVDRLYCGTYVKQEDKDRISDLIDEIVESYHGILEDADFISDETRAKAIEKLDAIDKRVLFPDDWSKYSYDGLDFASKENGGTFWDADSAINEYLRKKDVEDFSKPVDKELWTAHAHEVNCFYEPQTNSIYIMGAFARGNVYNSDMSDEELYAKLGTVIGHEISHAFDSKGAQFDKDGNRTNWWTEKDSKAFEEKNDKLAAYLCDIHPWEGQDMNGYIMTGETCADMAGFKCMLRIASQRQNFDYDKFFRAFANMWLQKETGAIAERVVDDVHPLPFLRVNMTLQQFDEFLNFYGIKEGDTMYLAPKDRVTIW